jgi:hypothetical protein
MKNVSIVPIADVYQNTWPGSRHAAFLKGDEEQMADHGTQMGIMELLDAVDEMQDAEDEGDIGGEADARNKIAAQGFTVVATAGRRGSNKKQR